jgi:hypothetical protein
MTGMDEPSRYTIQVTPDPDRFNRYRWHIYEGGKLRDTSVLNFATLREAYADAERFVDLLSSSLGRKAIEPSDEKAPRAFADVT